MSRANQRRKVRTERLLAERQASASAQSEVLARKRKRHDAFLDRHGLRLATRDIVLFPFKFVAHVFWWPIKIWLRDESSSQQRRRGYRGNGA